MLEICLLLIFCLVISKFGVNFCSILSKFNISSIHVAKLLVCRILYQPFCSYIYTSLFKIWALIPIPLLPSDKTYLWEVLDCIKRRYVLNSINFKQCLNNELTWFWHLLRLAKSSGEWPRSPAPTPPYTRLLVYNYTK